MKGHGHGHGHGTQAEDHKSSEFAPHLEGDVLTGINSDHYTWVVDDRKLTANMLRAKHRQKAKSRPFTMANLRWELEIYPNGNRDNVPGFVNIYLNLHTLPSVLEEIELALCIRCDRSGVGHSDIAQYSVEAMSWGMGGKELPLALWRTMNVQSLSITVTISILNVTLSKPNRYLMLSYLGHSGCAVSQYKPLHNEMTMRYEWNLDFSESARFKASSTGQQFISKIYDNMWQLECWPNGWRSELAGNMSLYLRLLNPPPMVQKIRVKYWLQCTEMKRKRVMNYEFDTDENQSWGEPKFVPLAALQNAGCLSFVVEMEIMSVTFMKMKSKGDIRKVVEPLHIREIITADSRVQDAVKEVKSGKKEKRMRRRKNTADTDPGEGGVDDGYGQTGGTVDVESLAAEIKEMKRQMEYHDKLKDISMKAMSLKMEEQKKVIQRLELQIQEMSMEIRGLKERMDENVEIEPEHSQLTQNTMLEHNMNEPQ